MPRGKSRLLCEACGERFRHGMCVSVGAVPDRRRYIHDTVACRRRWKRVKQECMALWPELRGKPHLRAPKKEVLVPRTRSFEPFPFSEEIRAWVAERLRLRKRRKGDIKAWFEELNRTMPQLLPRSGKPVQDYNQFYALVREEELLLQRGAPPVPAIPAVPEPVLPVEPPPPVPVPASQGDTDELRDVVVAYVRLIAKRGDRETLASLHALLSEHILRATPISSKN